MVNNMIKCTISLVLFWIKLTSLICDRDIRWHGKIPNNNKQREVEGWMGGSIKTN